MNIREAAELTGLSNDTIRYYERIGIIMPVPRRENGVRDFTERNINQLKFAKIMRNAGLGIESLREYVGMVYENNERTIPDRKALLIEQVEEIEAKIEQMQKAHDYLIYKVDNYDGHMRDTEKSLSITDFFDDGG